MGMHMSLVPTIELTHTCGLCGQIMGKTNMEDSIDAILFGAAMYTLCPTCHQYVDKSHWTDKYKRGWEKKSRGPTMSTLPPSLIQEIRIERVLHTEYWANVTARKRTQPICVVEHAGDYYIIDGNHRFLGAKRAGAEFIRCWVVKEEHRFLMSGHHGNWIRRWVEGVDSYQVMVDSAVQQGNKLK